MADQEIAKHSKNVIRLFAQKDHPFWHKMREIALEVRVIVFAVSVSIWLHGWAEHRHEQQEVKAFLLGLRHDLETDIAMFEKSAARFESFDAQFAYLAKLDPAAAPEAEKFDAAYDKIGDYYFGVVLQRARYDSFKSSGKLGNIEDEALLEKVVQLYEYRQQGIHAGEELWRANLERLKTYTENGVDAGGQGLRYKLITAAKGRRLCMAMDSGPLGDYRSAMEFDRNLIGQIDLVYPSQTPNADKGDARSGAAK